MMLLAAALLLLWLSWSARLPMKVYGAGVREYDYEQVSLVHAVRLRVLYQLATRFRSIISIEPPLSIHLISTRAPQ